VNVANCREAGYQSGSSIPRADQGLPRWRLSKHCRSADSWSKCQVGVAVDQAREHSHGFEIDYLSSRGYRDIGSDCGYSFTFDQNNSVVDHVTGAHVQNSSGPDGDNPGLLSNCDDRREADNEDCV
jgi:hypothetical protein